MSSSPDFDLESAHRYFSAHCFNQAWELMDRPVRTSEEDQQMIQLNQASLWHWTKRADCTSQHRSVGYWQASRIYSLLQQADNARRYAEMCLAESDGLAPFYVAYAYEALARAEKVAGNTDGMRKFAKTARALAVNIRDTDSQALIMTDLEELR